MELARQAQGRAPRNNRQDDETRVQLRHRKGRHRGFCRDTCKDRHGQRSDCQQRQDFHHGFYGDCQDETGIVPCPVSAPRAEQDGEQRHAGSDQQDKLLRRNARLQFGIERKQRTADRLQLQGHVGQRSDRCDDSDQRRHARALAVSSGQEIRDRGRMLRLGLGKDAAHQAEAEGENQDRAKVDRKVMEPAIRGRPDAAEEGPAGAIDCKAEAVDPVPPAARRRVPFFRPAVLARGEPEQGDQIQSCCSYRGAEQHRIPPSGIEAIASARLCNEKGGTCRHRPFHLRPATLNARAHRLHRAARGSSPPACGFRPAGWQ